VKKQGTVTKTEKLLLGLTALFLCGLLVLYFHDRQAAKSAAISVETEHAVSQEEILQDLVPVNLNTATEAELAELPGIGPELACRIVEYRKEHGPFESPEEVMAVSGIGEGKFEDMKERITVEETA